MFIAAALGYLAWAVTQSPYFTDVNVPREQPVPFSHKHHVTDDGIDCRYCHTSVEKSSFAGIPSTHICMSCHSRLVDHQPHAGTGAFELSNRQVPGVDAGQRAFPTLPILTTAFISIRALDAPRATARLAKCH